MSRHNLKDEQWAVIEPLILKQKPGAGKVKAVMNRKKRQKQLKFANGYPELKTKN